jgi:hypothetical protein
VPRQTAGRPRRSADRTLRPGDLVRIRRPEQILATLDANGAKGGMPFMPEMLAFAGETVRLAASAHRTCDTITFRGQRRTRDLVHLDGLRCTGEAHGGCQAGCLLFWNKAWLERADQSPSPLGATGGLPAEALIDTVRQGTDERGAELLRASELLPWWRPGQYVRDVTTGNATPLAVISAIVRWLSVKFRQRVLSLGTIPGVRGRLEHTPRSTLDLRPGERVRVRDARAIESTLDRSNRTRGLSFDQEMLRYCGTERSVLRRVERIIEESSGRLITMQSDCIILDGAVCKADYHRLCPRAVYPWWREAWLERVAAVPGDQAADTRGPLNRA